jgi:hypothetical protein
MAETKQGKVLKTLQDIESLFEFGGEITPFLEELFRFLNDLMPLLARARCYLQSTSSSAPAASDNIHSAEQMAEDATNTIMDNADQICVQLGDLQAGDGNGDTKKVLEEVVHRAQQIQMSLQFQDITSQHLQQATRIVEAIHTKLDQMFLGLEEMGQHNELVQKLVEKYAHVEDCDQMLETEDTIHRGDNAISQDDIDALFGGQ